MNDEDHSEQGNAKDLSLRDDIRLLGRFLGDTLREQEGEETFKPVERVRQTAVRFRRTGDEPTRAKVRIFDSLRRELESSIRQLMAITAALHRAAQSASSPSATALSRRQRKRANQAGDLADD